MKKIDALGLACPHPVILAKKAITEGNMELEVLVDNKVATENLSKLAAGLGYSAQVNKEKENLYSVVMQFTGEILEEGLSCNEDYIVVLSADAMGIGSENIVGNEKEDEEKRFSARLMESFVYALSEQEVLPKMILMYNRGVFLSTVREKVVGDLKKMEEKGVEVLSCGLCLDYYNLKEKLSVGSVTNMYKIVDAMRKYKVVKP